MYALFASNLLECESAHVSSTLLTNKANWVVRTKLPASVCIGGGKNSGSHVCPVTFSPSAARTAQCGEVSSIHERVQGGSE